jgi:hypothetical protein
MAVPAVMDGIPSVGAGRVLAGGESEGGEQGENGGEDAHQDDLTCRAIDYNPLTRPLPLAGERRKKEESDWSSYSSPPLGGEVR